MRNHRAPLIALILYLCASIQAQTIPLKPDNLVSYGVTLKTELYKGKQALVVEQTIDKDNDNHYTFARLKGLDFHNGIIEITIAGQPKKNAVEGARGFVGIAFRIPQDTSKFEVFYLRPANGRANDQVRRNHSLQYVSYPGFPWPKLRKETPEKYESYADIVTGEWIKIRIEVKDETAKLFVNGAEQPSLIVNDLKQGKNLRGSIGVWVAIGTLAQFTDLKITKYD
jgi:hypothetical protein